MRVEYQTTKSTNMFCCKKKAPRYLTCTW